MSMQNIRRSVLIAAGIGALAFAGLFAGRLFAHQMGGHFHGDMAPRMFRHIARDLDLSESQQAQIRDILKAHADEIGVVASVRRDRARRARVRLAVAAAAALLFFFFAGTGHETATRPQAGVEVSYTSMVSPDALEGLIPN